MDDDVPKAAMLGKTSSEGNSWRYFTTLKGKEIQCRSNTWPMLGKTLTSHHKLYDPNEAITAQTTLECFLQIDETLVQLFMVLIFEYQHVK